MNRRVAPFLAAVLIAAGVYWALEKWSPDFGTIGPRPAPAPEPQMLTRPPPAEPETQPAPITTTRFTEPDPEPESRPESAPAVVELVVIQAVREDGRPIPGAVLGFADRNDGIPTDAVGRVEISARPGVSIEVTVAGDNFCPVRVTVALDSGTRRIVVPDRGRVAGRVTVQGAAPEDPIAFRLRANYPPGCCDDFWFGIGAGGSSISGHDALTNERGEFEFFNLPPTWSGQLETDLDYELAEKHGQEPPPDDPGALGRLELGAPNPSLDIRLVERPAIKGRVVPESIAREAKPALVRAVVRRGEETWNATARGSQSGRFRLGVPKDTTSASVVISDAFGLGSRSFELQGPFDSVRHLGDIELASVRRIELVVKDDAGNPVAGAMAQLADSTSRSGYTDDDGRAALHADVRPGQLRVAKVGYRTAIVPVPGTLDAPLEVELQSGNVLVIEARMADGSVSLVNNTVFVELRSTGTLFSGPNDQSDELHPWTGATQPWKEGSGEDGSIALYNPDPEGRVIVAGLRPGQVTVQLRGRVLNEIVADSFITVDAVGSKTVTLRTDGMPTAFAGRIRTAGGDPIDDAWVVMSAPGIRDGNGGTGSGAEGRFEIAGIFALSVDVSVWKEGFVPLRLKDVPVPPPGAERDFILVPSHDVTIALVDDQRRPVLDEAEVWLTGFAGERIDAEPQGDGSYVVNDLPPGRVDVHVLIGTTAVDVVHDTRRPVARVVIPSGGTAEIHWLRDPSDPPRARIRVERLPDQETIFQGDLEGETLEHRLDVTLPAGDYWVLVERIDRETEEWVAIATSPAFEIASYFRTVVDVER